MGHFLSELKRRHIYRVGAAYVVIAWALAQGIDVLSQVFELPSWIAQPAVVLLAVGFPVALVAAWLIENKPHEAVVAAVRSKHTTVDWMLFGAMALLIALTVYQQIRSPSIEAAEQPSVRAARDAAASANAVSVAVLPFANVSADPEQEFFADGITDEISGALAKIPDLRVVGRSSAFQYKTRNTDLRTIGQALNATHLIEGSVRTAGERVRITVQLSLADNGLQLWSENYDRELLDVFAIQEDIARAIAASLNMQLGLRPGENLVNNRNIDPETYQLFLRARAQFRGRTGGGNVNIEQLIARDPGFAPSWGLKAQGHVLFPFLDNALMVRSVEESRREIQSRLEEGEKAAREAMRLDPQLATAYAVLGAIEGYKRNWAASVELYNKAIDLDPNDPDNIETYGTVLATIGYLKEALRLREQVHALEPFIPDYNNFLGQSLVVSGRIEDAIRTLEAGHATGGQLGFEKEVLARAYFAAERYEDALRTMLAIPKGRYGDSGQLIENAAGLLRNAPTKSVVAATLPVVPGRLNFVYAHVSAPGRMMEYPERAFEVGIGTSSGLRNIWDPINAPLRKTEGFKALMRKAGLLDYWRAKGWPDLCQPIGADDFECD
jgi:TolB-like protein